MFKIDMLKADWGDCLWIEYGDSNDPKRILIDGGTTKTYDRLKDKILKLPDDKRHFELLVITHVDTDHIDGAIKLIGLDELKVTFGDVWFNGYKHLQIAGGLGGLQGEFLTVLLERKNLNWNKAFGGKPVVVTDNRPLPVIDLGDNNLKITLLSPTRERLKELIPDWDKHLKKYHLDKASTTEEILAVLEKRRYLPAGIVARLLGDGDINIVDWADEDFEEDESKANGSSIAFLMEYDDPEDNRSKSCLFTGDAYPSVLAKSIKRLLAGRSRLKLDLLKASHHGSRNNIDRNFLRLIDCEKFLISSNGKKYKHPDKQAISRIIAFSSKSNPPHIYFNYVSDYNKIWNDRDIMRGDFPYQVTYAEETDDHLSIKL